MVTNCIYVYRFSGDSTRSRPLSVPFSSDNGPQQSELTLRKPPWMQCGRCSEQAVSIGRKTGEVSPAEVEVPRDGDLRQQQ